MADEHGGRAVLFSEAALREDPDAAVEELRHADVGVVVVGRGNVVVAESTRFAEALELPDQTHLSEALERLYDEQNVDARVDLSRGMLHDAVSGATLRLAISGIQLPSPDPDDPGSKRYRCTNLAERHVVRSVSGSANAPCPKDLVAGGRCPGLLEVY